MRFFAILFIILNFNLINANNIKNTKKALKYTSYKISKMNAKLDYLAKNILKRENEINLLSKQENTIRHQIKTLQEELKNSNKDLNELQTTLKTLQAKKESISDEIIKFISQNYYLDTQKINSLNDLIYSEINKKILNIYAKKIALLSKALKNINKNISEISQKISSILSKKLMLQQKQQELAKLKNKKLLELKKLKKQKEFYKEKLVAMLKKQERLRKKLQELKIVTKRIHVKTFNPNYKIKTASYKGTKTISPVRGKIIKKFGSYIDPIYKIRIYNDSITIKTKPNAIIRAIKSGKVVYIGKANDKYVIFIKHKGNLFSIYANLEKVSPLLKKGSYVKKGQIIARVKEKLEFEVTYKDKPINPLKVIKLY
ncbi:MAG: peptidoglycan DD-metalloendopeptidase family protein [Nautiliaceae bacterium]